MRRAGDEHRGEPVAESIDVVVQDAVRRVDRRRLPVLCVIGVVNRGRAGTDVDVDGRDVAPVEAVEHLIGERIGGRCSCGGGVLERTCGIEHYRAAGWGCDQYRSEAGAEPRLIVGEDTGCRNRQGLTDVGDVGVVLGEGTRRDRQVDRSGVPRRGAVGHLVGERIGGGRSRVGRVGERAVRVDGQGAVRRAGHERG